MLVLFRAMAQMAGAMRPELHGLRCALRLMTKSSSKFSIFACENPAAAAVKFHRPGYEFSAWCVMRNAPVPCRLLA